MLWLATMGRRLNGVYASFMLVAFMIGIAGALQAPTLSLFLSREVGVEHFWIGLFYTINAIAVILISLWLAKPSDAQGDRRKLIMFCCLMAVGNALLFAFNRHYLTLPSMPRVAQPMESDTLPTSGWKDLNVRMLFIVSMLMWTCNTMYIIDMPLWISNDLGLPDKLAGILMGTAAGLDFRQ